MVFDPVDASDKRLTFTSSNEDVATVDENGVVTIVSDYNVDGLLACTITATSWWGGHTAELAVCNNADYHVSKFTNGEVSSFTA